jgi:ATP-dependent helicase/nuclease subunit B
VLRIAADPSGSRDTLAATMTGGADAHLGLLISGRFPELEDALCERVAELKRDDALAPITIVVGSAAVRTCVGDLVVRRRGAVANLTVSTLGRLASDLVASAQGAPPAVLSGLARERLVRRLVSERAGELEYFRPVVDRPHFPQALAATLTDLREACVPAGSALSDAVSTVSPAAMTSGGRARDLDRLYAAFCAELGARGLADGAGVQAAAAAAVSLRLLPGAVILFGVYDLNQAQESLVKALIAQGADVFVPVPAGAERSALATLDVAARLGLVERRLAPPRATYDRERLSALWGDAAGDAPLQLAGDGTLAVVSVSDERVELREAVRSVLAAVEGGASAWDCALAVSRGDAVESAATALQEAGLPVACRVPDRSTGSRLLVKLADCLAPTAGETFSRRAVIDLLAAGPLRGGGEAGETALWLDEARQAGVVAGPAQWKSRLTARRRGLERRLEDLEARGAGAGVDDDDEVSGKAEAVRRRLAAAQGLWAAAGALLQTCGEPPERASWGVWAEFFAVAVAAVFDQGAADEARDAAFRLQALAVLDEQIGVEEAAGVLRDLLAGARVPRGRVGRDGVAVVTPLELRGLSFHTVVFTGLAEGGFPARGRPDPLLGDAERRRVGSALGVRLPLAEQRDAESLLLFAFACEAARERLILLAPRSSAADGRPRLPSRLLLRLASLAVGRAVGLDEFLEGEPLRPVWRRLAGSPGFSDDVMWVDERERDTAVLLALGSAGRRAAAQSYAGGVLGDADAAARRLGAWRSARSPVPGPWDGLLGAEARAALASAHPFDAEMHPTRLERYVNCPFAFLLRDVYGLQAPDEPGDSLEMDAREFGTLAHDILQRAYQQVIDDDLRRDGAMAAVLVAWTACCAEAEARGLTGAALSWEVRRELLREDLLETVRRDPVFSDPASRPAHVEWRFGESVDRPVLLELPEGRTVRFAGRLDRVDATASGARIIDYKSGGGGTERNHIKERLSVQLPVYRLAFRQAGEGDPASISCLYRLVTRRGGFEDLDLPQDENASTGRLRALVATAVALVDAGMFPRTTRQRCEYCDVRYACGVSGWARARKREHESLDPVIGLQSAANGEDVDV